MDVSRFRVNLSFRPITGLCSSDACKVLDIRNEDGVRKNMYTDHRIGRDEHFSWIEGLRTSSSAVFYAVVHNAEIVGGVGISAINKLHRRADWAFYLSENTRGKGIGSSLEYQFVNKVFSDFEVDKLNCEVISFNEKVVGLHERFGFKIEGARRDHVIRDGSKYDAILLGITKAEWQGQWA